jgi:hypothetical protein
LLVQDQSPSTIHGSKIRISRSSDVAEKHIEVPVAAGVSLVSSLLCRFGHSDVHTCRRVATLQL